MERQGSEESEGQLQESSARARGRQRATPAARTPRQLALTGTLGSLDSLDTLLTARQRVYTVCLRALTHENAKETSRCKGDKSLTDKPPSVCRTRWVSYDGMTRGEAKAALVKFLQKHCGMPLTVSVLRLSAPPLSCFLFLSRSAACTQVLAAERTRSRCRNCTEEERLHMTCHTTMT